MKLTSITRWAVTLVLGLALVSCAAPPEEDDLELAQQHVIQPTIHPPDQCPDETIPSECRRFSCCTRLFRNAEVAPVNVGNGRAVFWSGDANKQKAIDAAYAEDRMTLAMRLADSPAGEDILTNIDSCGTPLARRQVWAVVSARFADEARGQVVLFVDGAHPDSIYIRVEAPILWRLNQQGLIWLDFRD